MSEDLSTYVQFRLTHFFDAVAGLSARDLRALTRASAVSRRALELDPDFLSAVAGGRWTAEHKALADEVRRWALACARRRAPLLGRRRLAQALEDAGLVVLNDACPANPLPSGLRERLAAPWTRATGRDPGHFAQAA